MKLLQELLALREHGTGGGDYRTFIFKDWDGQDPPGFFVKPFDVEIEYYYERASHSDHPYQNSYAREHHPGVCSVEKIMAAQDVVFFDEATGKEELKRFPKGTELKDIPGWDQSIENFFQDATEEECE